MFVEPVGLDREQLTRVLASDWALEIASLRYEPVGFGTHHYVARNTDGSTWFVNVDDVVTKSWLGDDPQATFDGLDRALRTSAALRACGLDFVHAPIERRIGGVVARLQDTYAVSVFEFIDGTSNPHGEYPSDHERRLVLAALGRMHAATHLLPCDLPRCDALDVPMRTGFFETLDDIATPWTGGPYAEAARGILAESADGVRRMFARYDELAQVVAETAADWVVTHGEPHASNVMRTRDGALRLIDWDTAALGPRERDLWMVQPRDDEDWSAYSSGTGVREVDRSAIELYELWWALSEITGYTDTLRSPHAADANTIVAWLNFQSYLPTR